MRHDNGKIVADSSFEYATPKPIFDHYNYIFGFTIDVAASDLNHKCDRYYTKEDDGLSKNWGGEKVWCNPPYGREIGSWVKKCCEESLKPGTLVCALLPVRTDTAYFQDYIQGKAVVQFLKGRLHFNDSKQGATFGSMICIWGI